MGPKAGANLCCCNSGSKVKVHVICHCCHHSTAQCHSQCQRSVTAIVITLSQSLSAQCHSQCHYSVTAIVSAVSQPLSPSPSLAAATAQIYTVSIKSKPNVLFCYNFKKIVHKFSSKIWQVATSTNAEWCALKPFTSPDVCTHTTL